MAKPQRKRLLLIKGSFEHFGGGERDLINNGFKMVIYTNQLLEFSFFCLYWFINFCAESSGNCNES